MPRFFNVAGPCLPGDHYLLPAQARLTELQPLIDAKQFFVIHAARQSGKTTLLLDLVRTLNEGPTYAALYLSCERAQGLPQADQGIPAVIEAMNEQLEWHPHLKPDSLGDLATLQRLTPSSQLLQALRRLSRACPRPLVVLLDEADCMGGETLILALRQLRDGYVNRGNLAFIHSLALVGMRNIRDFKASVRPDSRTLGSASPFNIVKESLTLRNFTRDEVGALYAQHTAETGQAFPAEVVDLIHAQTQGQPWLVNAIACQIVEKELARDVTRPITVATAQAAIQALILRRDTHIDSLLERLKEDRVRRVVEPVIVGAERELDMLSDDVRYCLDLGLLRSDKGELSAACPIYAEVICRALSWSSQAALPKTMERTWMTSKAIDLDALLRAFQEFWRENSDIWAPRELYPEAAPHLILMAFLQRVVNGGAYIAREFATGRKRLDLDVQYAGRHHPIELKLWYGPKARGDGERQLADYCRSLGTSDGWLVLFDRRAGRTWDERIFWETVVVDGVRLRVIGC